MGLYFVPTRVTNEFRGVRFKFNNLTIPIIKRKLTAMIWATEWRKELINKNDNWYKHEFNGIVIIVEENKKCVQRVYTNPLSRKDDGKSASNYKNACKKLGLNSDKNNFKPVNINIQT